MGPLEVDPGVVRAASAAVAAAGHQLASLTVGESLRSAANGVASLQTSGACLQAATAFDNNFSQLSSTVGTLANNLQTAADYYQSTDATQGQHIGRAGEAFGR